MYVSAFSLISREVDPAYVEFSLGAASLADSLGVALADVAGILIQARGTVVGGELDGRRGGPLAG